jgi:Holliday junction resolvase RusA-like endonuclease
VTEGVPTTFAMVLAVKPISANAKPQQSRWYTQLLQEAARARRPEVMFGPLYARIIWFQGQPTTGDVDNIAKRILDALKGIVFDDDGEIVRCLTEKTVTSSPSFLMTPSEAPTEAAQAELETLVGTAQHVLYVEVGPVPDLRISFGPVG